MIAWHLSLVTHEKLNEWARHTTMRFLLKRLAKQSFLFRNCFVALLVIYGTVSNVVADTPYPQEPILTTDEMVESAEAVIERIAANNVQAAKEVNAVFLAANRLVQ